MHSTPLRSGKLLVAWGRYPETGIQGMYRKRSVRIWAPNESTTPVFRIPLAYMYSSHYGTRVPIQHHF